MSALQATISALLKVDQLSWSTASTNILHNINCQFEPGKMYGVIGPNGAGKSSLLRCLYRVNKPSSGQVCFKGQDIWSLKARTYAQKIAVVLQETPSNFAMTVEQLVAMGLTPHKPLFSLTTEQDHTIVTQAIERVGLSEHRQQAIDSLSGGEKQRALIARAIVQQPQILIMDEPTNHLDVKYQIQVLELVKSLGITVIVSIHDLNLASATCDELLVLNNGELVSQGSPKQVITADLLADVFGVCAQVAPHPQTNTPSICYYYGYHAGEEQTGEGKTGEDHG